jgi:hypothetical protein
MILLVALCFDLEGENRALIQGLRKMSRYW